MQTTHLIGMLIAVQIIGLLAMAIASRLNAEKARATGYDEGYDDAKLALAQRITALHSDIARLQEQQASARLEHGHQLEAIMQDCDQRIATYSRRAAAVTHQDIQQLILIAKQLERAGSAYSHQGAVEGARMAHQAQLEALNLAERIRAALDQQPQPPADAEQEKVA